LLCWARLVWIGDWGIALVSWAFGDLLGGVWGKGCWIGFCCCEGDLGVCGGIIGVGSGVGIASGIGGRALVKIFEGS
jgi:hypothetical protein